MGICTHTRVHTHASMHTYMFVHYTHIHACRIIRENQMWGLLIQHLPFRAAEVSPESRPRGECTSTVSWCLVLALVCEDHSKTVNKVNRMIHVYHPVHYQALFWAQRQ